MSYMKRHLEEIQNHLEHQEWRQALELLKPWGDDLANQLLGTVENLADNQLAQEPAPMNWHGENVITKEMGQECFDTKSLIALFTELQRNDYSALSLGLIIDLVRRDALRAH